MGPFVRSPYNYDVDLASYESGLECLDASMTKQSFREEVDINTIVKRFGLTGQLPPDIRAPEYGDFTQVVDFHTALNAVALARESFDALSGEVRARFHNDPQELLVFVSDEGNRAEARKLGLLVPEVVVPVVPPVVVPAVAPLAPV